MSNNTQSTFINLPNDVYPENVWYCERNWEHLDSTCFDNNFGEVKEPNDTIESIRYTEEGEGWSKRYKYVKKNKDGVYIYRSFRLYKQFLNKVEHRGLVKNSTVVLSKERVTDDYFRSGLEEVYG